MQCDEIWSFVYAKDKNLPTKFQGKYGVGSIWTWTAIDADSKLMISWLVGNRDAEYAKVFMEDVASRLKNRVQLTTDGLKAYLEAIDQTFGIDIDYAQLVKLYGNSLEGEHRYSPADCTGAIKQVVTGDPKAKHISTSYVERQNLTMRMSLRRFTRLTNAFSKKVENHAHAIALHFMYYNFVRIHKTLRVTPAMAAGISKKLWSIEDLAKIVRRLTNEKRNLQIKIYKMQRHLNKMSFIPNYLILKKNLDITKNTLKIRLFFVIAMTLV